MSRTKFFIKNSLAMLLQQFINLAVAFIVPRFLLVTYGSEINGLIVSITQFILYFTIVEAGISGASIYSLYKPLADKDTEAINSILSATKKFYLKSGYIFLALVSVFSIGYPFFIKIDTLSHMQVLIVIFSIGMGGVFDFFTLSKYRVLLTADQKSYVISLGTILSSIVKILLVVIFCNYKLDVVWLQVFLVLSVYVRSLVLWIYTKRHYHYLNFDVSPNNDAIKDRWNVLYLQLLGSVRSYMPVVILTLFNTLDTISVYSIYNMVLTGINSILGIFMSGLAASFGDVISRKELTILQKAMQEFETFYYSLITLVYSVSLFLIIPFITLYTKGVHDTNYIFPFLGFLFILNGLLDNLKTPQGMLVISAGLYRQTRGQSTIQALLMICFGFPLGKIYGIVGVLIGMIVANIYRDIDLLFFIPQNVTKLSYKNTLYKILLSLFTFFISYCLSLKLTIYCDNYMDWAFYGIFLTLTIGIWIVSINLLFDKNNVKDILSRFRNLYSKKIFNTL